MIVHLRIKRYLKGAHNKLAFRKFEPSKILKKISSNAYMVDLPYDLQISPIFNVSNLFKFYRFDKDLSLPIDKDWIKTLPMTLSKAIEKVLDMKEVESKRRK